MNGAAVKTKHRYVQKHARRSQDVQPRKLNKKQKHMVHLHKVRKVKVWRGTRMMAHFLAIMVKCCFDHTDVFPLWQFTNLWFIHFSARFNKKLKADGCHGEERVELGKKGEGIKKYRHRKIVTRVSSAAPSVMLQQLCRARRGRSGEGGHCGNYINLWALRCTPETNVKSYWMSAVTESKIKSAVFKE